MKTGFKVAVVAVILLIMGMIFTQALDLISKKSDFMMYLGVVLLLVEFVILCGAPKFLKWLFTTNDKKESGSGSTTAALFLLIALSGLYNTGCVGCTTIQPGHVGIVVNMFGEEKGVDTKYTAVTGFVTYNPISKKVFEYPTFVQTAVWTRNEKEGSPNNEEVTFNSKEGLVITADISLSYHLEADKVPAFYVMFRSDDLNTFTHGFMRNVARDAFNELAVQYTVEELYGIKKEEFIKAVTQRVNEKVNPYGVIIEQFGFIGAMRIPENVMKALNDKITAIQQAIMTENQIRLAEAEAKKNVAIAEGNAEANRRLAASITPALIQWKQLQIAEASVTKWDGRRPMVEGSASGMIYQLPEFK